MKPDEIVRRRLFTQGLVGSTFERPADVVRWLGAVQAQDYQGALWAIGQRTKAATAAVVEAAIAERSIVRSWPMRGTLHFVPAGDLRWMLKTLAARVLSRAKGRYRELGLDDATFRRSRARLEAALPGKTLTRDELYEVLERGRISAAGQRGIHILGYLAMQGVICFGARRGKQVTFALLDEWLAPSPTLDRDEALERLAHRYFTGHGPATVHDFAWWAGLPMGDAKTGLELARRDLTERVVAGTPYWSGAGDPPKSRRSGGHLLPAWDEYAVAYRDRGAIVDAAHAAKAKNGIFSPVVIMDGRVVGTWTREMGAQRVRIALHLFGASASDARRTLAGAVERFGDFHARDASIA